MPLPLCSRLAGSQPQPPERDTKKTTTSTLILAPPKATMTTRISRCDTSKKQEKRRKNACTGSDSLSAPVRLPPRADACARTGCRRRGTKPTSSETSMRSCKVGCSGPSRSTSPLAPADRRTPRPPPPPLTTLPPPCHTLRFSAPAHPSSASSASLPLTNARLTIYSQRLSPRTGSPPRTTRFKSTCAGGEKRTGCFPSPPQPPRVVRDPALHASLHGILSMTGAGCFVLRVLHTTSEGSSTEPTATAAGPRRVLCSVRLEIARAVTTATLPTLLPPPAAFRHRRLRNPNLNLNRAHRPLWVLPSARVRSNRSQSGRASLESLASLSRTMCSGRPGPIVSGGWRLLPVE